MRSFKHLITLFTAAVLILLSPLTYSADREADLNTHTGISGSTNPQDQKDGTRCPGSPVYLEEMTFFWKEVDVALAGKPGISLNRIYNSYDGREGIFGKGWSASCERSLTKVYNLKEIGVDAESGQVITADQILYIYRSANGRLFEFIEDGTGDFISPNELPALTLEEQIASVRLIALGGGYEEYNQQGQLIADVGRNGNRITYSYADGALTGISNNSGQSLTLTYDTSGHVISVTDHTNREWTYQYNSDGTLTSVTDPLSDIRQYEYQDFQPPGSGQIYALLTKIIDASGVVITEVSYDSEGKVNSYTEGSHQYTYTRGTYYDYATSQYLENRTKRGYNYENWVYYLDENGYKTRITDPTNNNTYFEYNEQGQVTKVTDANGTEFTTAYDALGRVISTTTPAGTQNVSFTADQPWPESMTSPTGRSVQFSYDAKGNVTGLTDPSGALTQMSWNDQGDLVSLTDALGNATQQTVNTLGQPLTITDALSRTVQFEYDARFNLSRVTDPLGNATTFEYDALDRMVKQTNVLGHVTQFSYDAASRLLSVTAPNDESVSYEYDSYGRRIKRTDYDGVEETYTYRADNLLSQSRDRANIATSYYYNRAKQLTDISVGGETTSYTYTPLGQLSSATNTTGTVSFTYDSLGRVTTESNNGQTISYSYNSESELSSYSAFGKTWNYSYDQRGLLTQIAAPQGDFDFQYDQLGRRTSLAMPNGSQTTYGFDAVGQLTTQQHSGIFSALYQYQYDSAGRMSDWSGDGAPKSYEYDVISRLTRAVDSFGDTTYSYDELGNHTNNAQTHDAANRLLEDADNSYTYDANGSLTQKQDKTTGARTVYSWNRQGQLIKLEQFADGVVVIADSTTTFAYGPLGRRWQRIKDGVIEGFVYSGQDRIGDLNGINALVANATFGPSIDEPLGLSRGGIDYVYHANHQGSILALTDTSQVVSSYQYGAYGATGVAGDGSLNSFGYTAREQEGEELYYYRARYYDSDLKRFIRSDPIGLNGGLNTYTYVNGNPISFIDPLGLAQIGDVAFFSWYGSTWPTHAAIVTRIDKNTNATHAFGAWGDTMTFHEVDLGQYNGGIQDKIIGYGDMSDLNSVPLQSFRDNWDGNPVAPEWDGSKGMMCIDAATATDGFGGNTLRDAMRQDYKSNPSSYRDFGAGPANPNSSLFYRRNGWLQQFFQNTNRYQTP